MQSKNPSSHTLTQPQFCRNSNPHPLAQPRSCRDSNSRDLTPLQLYQAFYNSPIGKITIIAHATALVSLCLDTQEPTHEIRSRSPISRETSILTQTKIWLEDYFRGKNPDPSEILLDPHGTKFQCAVWEILAEIPYGELTTYGEVSRQLTQGYCDAQSVAVTATDSISRGTKVIKSSPRAVGGAVGRNPISIIIPCHRVVGATRKLTGYTGGLDKKQALLRIEGVDLTQFR